MGAVDIMAYTIIDTGGSRSFPAEHAFTKGAARDGEVVVIIGSAVGAGFSGLADYASKAAVLLELGTECLGVYTGESRGEEGSNVLGFARFCLGDGKPSQLVELVRQPRTSDAAIAAATRIFEGA